MTACGDGKLNASAGEQCEGDVENASCEECLVVCNVGFSDCDDDLTCETQLCGGTCDNPGPLPGMETFDFSGEMAEFVVPDCIEEVSLEVRGAQGGNSSVGPSNGGRGGEATGDLMVTPGESLYVYVGEVGSNSSGNNNGAWLVQWRWCRR